MMLVKRQIALDLGASDRRLDSARSSKNGDRRISSKRTASSKHCHVGKQPDADFPLLSRIGIILTTFLLIFVLAGVTFGQTIVDDRDFTQFVNPLIGTDGYGNTFPGATLPFGMIQWSPDTTGNGFYKYRDTKIRGFSLTHLSGAGCPIFGDIPFLPTLGPVTASPAIDATDYSQPFLSQ